MENYYEQNATAHPMMMDEHDASEEQQAPAEQQPLETPRAQVIWVGSTEPTSTRDADPYDVINFLLKKLEDQQARIAEHEGFAELQNQEIEVIKQELSAKAEELEVTQADYDVMLQNSLATERELEQTRARASELELQIAAHEVRAAERPRIQLPFHTEQKLAKLGYGDQEAPVQLREAV